MPGKSYSGTIPPLTAQEITLRDALQRDVEKLAGEIGERNSIQYQNLEKPLTFSKHLFKLLAIKLNDKDIKLMIIFIIT